VGPCPPTVAYEIRPALVRISEEDSRERAEKQCEGHRGWMTGGRARMAFSETGVARSQVCARLFQCNLMFGLGFW